MELWENCPGENKFVAPKIQNMCFTTTTATTCRRRQSLQSLPASVEILLGYRYCNLRWSTNTAANHCLDIDEKPMLQPPLDIDEIPIQLPANVEIPMRYRCCSHRWATDIVANHCWDTDCSLKLHSAIKIETKIEAALSHQNRIENQISYIFCFLGGTWHMPVLCENCPGKNKKQLRGQFLNNFQKVNF